MEEEKEALTPTAEAEGTGNPTPEGEGEGTSEGQSEPTVDYREKFANSAREAQRLLDENRTRLSELAQAKAQNAEMERKMRELEDLARGNNPEGYDSMQLRSHIERLGTDLAQMKERQELEEFVRQHPEADKYRDTLRDLGRAYTGKSYRDIWDTSLKSVAEAERLAGEAKDDRRKSAPESGRGRTGEPSKGTIGGYTLDKFNSLPVDKRREILKKLEAL